MSQAEHAKLYRLFNLLSRLRSPLGCTAEEYSRDFNTSTRTYERYICFLKEFGFTIIKEVGRHKIEKLSRDDLLHEDLFVFTLEEAALIRDAIINQAPDSPLKIDMLQKLQALSDLEMISDNISKAANSRNISTIREAIRYKKQVKLINYQSANSNTISDRLVEPVRFTSYFRYLEAYEPASDQVKEFKTERIGTAEKLHRKWQHEERHSTLKSDLFGMTGKPVQAKLLLSMRAARLLEEEFPGAEDCISKTKEGYLFETTVNSYSGIGRFVLGLPGEVRIMKPVGLKRFVKEKAGEWVR